MDFRFDLVEQYMPYFLRGTLITIEFSILGIIFGTIVGLIIGIGKMSENRVIRFPFVWYINFFRGTPLFVQILLVHFAVIPTLTGKTNAFLALVVALSINSGAYISEIFRAGIQSIDRGQMEAARSLGMTHRQAMRLVILPQAVKRMIPPLGNEFIVLIKDSSLGAVIAAPELMYWGRAMQGQYYRPWEPYLTVALIYFVLTLLLTYLVNYIERRVSTE
ncbi:amino acid ABC transporter permease [Bacillus sp. FJAT-49736]|uniref:amino acid ABC transporter permease n=1 Tax=Bacillus sp. FJAT-49736 TaxID=2833582 RepID=UPI001BC92BA0|nr:amino acid ABC transporter permease [Bacillus sp. FJAT-49736]MBS4174874.1 amino acid ABC transporter permease [Bacillus sp. FJAT-49736]